MPFADVRGVRLYYEVLGSAGPWVCLAEGGRSGVEEVRGLASRVAAAGYRVVVHDRRNCGASDVSIDGEGSEPEIGADDLYELLKGLGALPVYAGGASSGCRLSLLLALRHPEAVSGLLLWRVSGGPFAAQYLAASYYDEFIGAALTGGMAAVCRTLWFQQRIGANASNRERLMAMDPRRFVEAMARWRAWFVENASLPVIGASAAALGGIGVPACILSGYDEIHPPEAAETAHRLIAGSELAYLTGPWGGPAGEGPTVYESDEGIAEAFMRFMRARRDASGEAAGA